VKSTRGVSTSIRDASRWIRIDPRRFRANPFGPCLALRSRVRPLVWLATVAAISSPSAAHAMQACINGPSSYGGSIDQAAADAVIALGPRCVRLPFRQDNYASVSAAFSGYDALVAKYLANGVEVHMLIHPESMNIDAHAPNTDAGRATYVTAATAIVDHFKNRVRRFELLNEPNNWDASKQATNPPDAFAALLADTYTAVKVNHAGDACWNVDLVSGALFAFHQSDGTGTSASDYLAQTYDAGIASHGWDAIKQKTGSYPLDGIGWHLYMEETTAAATASLVNQYIDDVWRVVTQHEPNSTKAIWVSETGFGTNGSAAQNAAQASGLSYVFDAFAAAPHVAMAMWFTYQDFDASGWGLYSAGGFDAAHARPSKDAFVAESKAKAEPLWAKLAIVQPPAAIVAGQRATIRVRATNLGSETWKRANAVRLGSGAGCPLTPSANAIAWSPVASDGYAHSPTDARIELGASVAVGQGSDAEFAVDVVAPTQAGTYKFAARMVKEGVAWFGTPVVASLVVVDGAGDDAGSDAGGSADAGAGAGGGAGAGAGAGASGDGGPGATAAPGAEAGSCACDHAGRAAGGGVWLALAAVALGIRRRVSK
jgi:hypothetical protein